MKTAVALQAIALILYLVVCGRLCQQYLPIIVSKIRECFKKHTTIGTAIIPYGAVFPTITGFMFHPSRVLKVNNQLPPSSEQIIAIFQLCSTIVALVMAILILKQNACKKEIYNIINSIFAIGVTIVSTVMMSFKLQESNRTQQKTITALTKSMSRYPFKRRGSFYRRYW